MSAMVRLKSKNKVDNYYAYKYYMYLILSIILFASGIYCWQEYSKFIGVFYFIGASIAFLYKNGYADYSNKSNCTHPNNLEDFMHSINIDKESRISQIIGESDESILFAFGGLILFLGCLCVPFGNIIYAKSHALELPSIYIILSNLTPVFITSSILIISGFEAKFWYEYDSSQNKVFAEPITPELLQKIEGIVFPVEGQKEEFAKKVAYSFSISNYVTRKALFNICYEFLYKSEKEHSLEVLNKLIKKDKV
jgi:hypothetical protein